MRIFFISIITLSTMIAQGGLKIIGGYDMSTIRYNDNNINSQNEISTLNSTNIGIEYDFSLFNIGANLIQRGSKLRRDAIIATAAGDLQAELSGHEIYNYVTAHIFYPITLKDKIQVFGGVLFGKSYGGESIAKLTLTQYNSSQSDTVIMHPSDFSLDAGLQFGIDYMLNHRFGLRTSYYLGMTNVRDTLNNDFNFKNRTINLSAFVNLKGLWKKKSTKEQTQNINFKSELLLPTSVFEVQMAGRIGSNTSPQSKIAIEYGLNDFISVGLSNSNYLNTIDLSARTNYLNKLLKNFKFPVNLVYNSVISIQRDKPVIIDKLDQLNFLHQLIIDYKINSNIRLELVPTYLHKNSVKTKLEPKGYPWDIWFFRTGINWALKNNIELYANVIQKMSNDDNSQNSKASLKFGFEYFIHSISLDLSITNLYYLHGTALIDDLRVSDNSENFRMGVQINKIFD